MMRRKTARKRTILSALMTTALVLSSVLPATDVFAAQPAASIYQMRNGAESTPVDPGQWVTGNIGQDTGHYVEGYSVPYRAVLTDLPVGEEITITFSYDVKHSDRHAIDYLTSYDRIDDPSHSAMFGHDAELVDPLIGTGITGDAMTYPIPAPVDYNSPVVGLPTSSFYALPEAEREMSIWNGEITDIQYVSGGDLSSRNSEATIEVTFVANDETAVIAFGGHIASRDDWGYDEFDMPLSAGGISGAPYHLSLDDWTLNNLGNQDLSFSAAAVADPTKGTIIVQKVTESGDGTFTFTSDFASDFDLSNGQSFESEDLDEGVYSVTEESQIGWELVSATCDDGSPVDAIDLQVMETVTCTFVNREVAALVVEKTAETYYESGYDWDIEKSVYPESAALFHGDMVDADYTVTVTNNGIVDSNWMVAGTITITNPASNTLDAMITDIVDELSISGEATVTCTEELPVILAPGETLNCEYSEVLDGAIDQTNNVTVETAGLVPGNTASADVVFGEPTVVGSETITVEDSNGTTWLFSTSSVQNYTMTFDCSDVEYVNGQAQYTYENTVTILETGESAQADLTVDCYALGVEKTVATTYDRSYDWSIDKVAYDVTDLGKSPVSSLTLADGQTYILGYDVTAEVVGYTDTNVLVSGEISIYNPNPERAAVLASVTDIMSEAGEVSVDCPTLTVEPLETLVCTYSASDIDVVDQTNTAIATLVNENINCDDPGTTTNFTDVVDVVFGEPANVENTSIEVTDTMQGVLGTVTAAEGSQTFSYTHELNFAAEECGIHELPNVASFVSTHGASGASEWNVTVDVRCPQYGCTLTQGYWKTHNDSFWGGAPTDDTWYLLANAEQTTLYDGMSWFEVFWTPTKGRPWYQLAHQWMAAKLNVMNEADARDLGDALDEAEAWLMSHSPSDKLKGPAAKAPRELASLFAAYNEGSIGPGHCDEQSSQE